METDLPFRLMCPGSQSRYLSWQLHITGRPLSLHSLNSLGGGICLFMDELLRPHGEWVGPTLIAHVLLSSRGRLGNLQGLSLLITVLAFKLSLT